MTLPAKPQRPIRFRQARPADLSAIVAMLRDDPLGALREVPDTGVDGAYVLAFEEISRSSVHEIVVGDDEGEVVAVLQLTFLRYLTYEGGLRAQIEGVRVRSDRRGTGLGNRLFVWAIERARERGAHIVQLTTDKRRPDALRFYERLGFESSHEGMKLHLR